MSTSNIKKIQQVSVKNIIKEREENNDLSYEKFQREILLEKMKNKEQQINDLYSKIKTQESKVMNINKILVEKDLNIKEISQNYKAQLSELKNLFGFKGDINFLLDKKYNTYEYQFVKKIRDTQNDNNYKENKINKLKNEINQLERDKEKLNLLIEIKKNDQTMIEVINSIKRQKKIRNESIQNKNEEEFKVIDLINKNNNLGKKIEVLKRSYDMSSNIINNFHFSPDLNNKEKKDFIVNEEQMKKELSKIKERENNETEIILNKYLKLIKQNKEEIIKGNDILNKIDYIYFEKLEKYKEELIQIFKLIQNFINYYYTSFNKTCSLYSKKEECDKLLEKEFKNLNILNFPYLYKELENNKNINYNIPNIKSKKKLKKDLKNLLNNLNNLDYKKIELINCLNFQENYKDYSVDEIILKKSKLFSSIEKKNRKRTK